MLNIFNNYTTNSKNSLKWYSNNIQCFFKEYTKNKNYSYYGICILTGADLLQCVTEYFILL